MANKVIKQGPPSGYPSSAPSRPSPPPQLAVRSGLSDPRTKKPVIEREVVGAKGEAREIIAKAETYAEQLRQEAQEQAEELRQKGYDEGYQEGLGRHTEQTARALLDVQRLREQVEPEFIGLVRTCVEKILAQELKLHPDAVIGIVRNALRDATQQREIIVRLHPEDAEVARKNKRKLMDVLARANEIDVREDPTIVRGGCVVVTELGTIDASLTRQLDAIEAVLQAELRSGGGDDSQASGDEGAGEPSDEAEDES